MSDLNFSGKGPLAAAIRARGGNPSARTAQISYAEAVAANLEEGRPAFIDAETGTGKTLGYLVPMLERAKTLFEAGQSPIIVVSTATIALQRQIMESDLPIALDAFERAHGRTLVGAMRVGRGQIVDPSRLVSAAEELAPGQVPLARQMEQWGRERIAEDVLPLRSDLLEAFADQISAAPAWLSEEACGLDARLGRGLPDLVDLYTRQLEMAEEADILVVNHALLTLHMMNPFLWAPDRAALVVVDEADRLPRIVESMRNTQVPLRELQRGAKAFGRGAENLLRETDDLMEEMEIYFERCWTGIGGGVLSVNQVDPGLREGLVGKIGQLRAALTVTLASARAQGARRDPHRRDLMATLERYGYQLDRILAHAAREEYGRAMLYYSPVRKYPGLAVSSDGDALMIARCLWSKPASPIAGLLFTSATLSTLAHGTRGSAKRALAAFVASCGFRSEDIPAESCATIAPARFGEMDFVRPPLDAPSAFVEGDGEPALSEEALEFWREMVDQAHAQGGRTLVLLPAFRDVFALAGELGHLGDDLVAQLPGMNTRAAIRRFLDRPEAVWVTASAWEGVSLPGAISHIVLPRIPIRPLGMQDSLLEQYISHRSGPGAARNAIFARQMAEARRRLRQGIGRGLRSHEDAVTVWIGDPRWPIPQREADALLLDQPRRWSSTMVNAVSERFRRRLERSARFERTPVEIPSGEELA